MKTESKVPAHHKLLEEVDSTDQHLNKSKIANGKSNFYSISSRSDTPTAGYGSCRACDCRGYISKHNGSHECKTCNHHYDRHN